MPVTRRPRISALRPPTRGIRPREGSAEEASGRRQRTGTAPTAAGPRGAVPSSSVHSRYQRHLTDLPCGTRAVRIQLTARKVRCRNRACGRRIFTERGPDRVAASGRHTHRAAPALRMIGLALGGDAGARRATRLRLPPRPSTLLRLGRAAPVPRTPALQAVGVDAWAWRRGPRSGTSLVHRADHRVVDLLPDRSAETGAAWLAEPPGLTGVGRDRSALYADGIRRGAPAAVPVVDRVPLVHNLRQVLEAFLRGHRPALQAAAVGPALALTPPSGVGPVTPGNQGRRRRPKPAPPPAERPPRHARWVAIDGAVRTLRARETPSATIARQLGISRPTVDACRRRDTPPGPRRRQRPPSARVLTPAVSSLIRRGRESRADSRQLRRELRALGDTPSARPVGRFIPQRRRAVDAGHPPESQRSPSLRSQGPSARAVSWVMGCPAATRSAAAQTCPDRLCQVEARSTRAYRPTQAFLALVRERRGRGLDAWMAATTDSGIGARARFARGLREDLGAVAAGLTLAWSHGPVEGQLTPLKRLKRRGYGRAGLAPLRQRRLPAA